MAAVVAGLVSFVSGLPFFPFLLIAGILPFGHHYEAGPGCRRSREASLKTGRGAGSTRKPENVLNLLQVDPVDRDWLRSHSPGDPQQGGDLLDRSPSFVVSVHLSLEL